MSAASVRVAVQNWFQAPNVTNLNHVYTPPEIPVQNEVILPDAATSGAIAFVHIERDSERRIAIGGATSGTKLRFYDVMLQVVFRSTSDGDVAQAAHDALIDAMKTRLRSDRTLGGTVWEAGEGSDVGANDIEVTYGSPTTTNNVFEFVDEFRFLVVEALSNT